MRKYKIVTVLILAFCMMLTLSMSVFAEQKDKENSKQHFRMVANKNQIKILQSLYKKDVSYGELVEKVYPEALEHISDKVLEQMYKTKVNWKNENPQSTQYSESTSYGTSQSTDIGIRSPYVLLQGVEHESTITKGSGYITHTSRSTVVQPFGLKIPSMTVISMLVQDDVGTVASEIDTGANDWNVFAPTPPKPYNYPLRGKFYYTLGSHFGEYLPGSTPATYSIGTNTAIISY